MSDDGDGAIVAMEQAGEWVRFADAKAGLIAAAAAGALALAAAQANDAAVAANAGQWWLTVIVALVIGAIVLSVATFWFVIQALVPRLKNDCDPSNRFAWPFLATMTLEEIDEHLTQTTASAEAWAQTKSLADIAALKYEWCRKALVSMILLIAVVIGFVGVSAIALHKIPLEGTESVEEVVGPRDGVMLTRCWSHNAFPERAYSLTAPRGTTTKLQPTRCTSSGEGGNAVAK